MSDVTDLHRAIKAGDLPRMGALLQSHRLWVDSRSETDPRGTYALHVAAEFGQDGAAQVLLEHGADVSMRDAENDAIALSWAAFFGRPGVVRILLEAGSDVNQRNRHGLTPLACALGGMQGRWRQFSNASLADWEQCAETLKAAGGTE